MTRQEAPSDRDSIPMLREWRVASPPSPLGLVFPSKAGGVLSEGNVARRGFKPALHAAAVELAKADPAIDADALFVGDHVEM